MANQLIDVTTYQRAELALLRNSYVYVAKANTKYKNPQSFTGNLGDSIDFDLPIKQVANRNSLVVPAFDPVIQRKQTLTVDQPITVANAYTAQERIFNVDMFMNDIGKSAMAELGDGIEANVALNNVSHTYRTFNDGTTDITSFQQLAQAAADYRNTGAPKGNLCGIIPDIKAPAIIGNGLNQFVLDRNERQFMSWELGSFARVDWHTSNLCPTHIAGTVGQDQATLTVVSINAAGTQLTLSGAGASDADAIKENDVLTFQDSGGVIRFLTEHGHQTSQQKVQVRATADAGSDGAGQVVVDIFPALNSTVGDALQNINTPVVAGMELIPAQSHIAGLLFYQPALMLGMPRLPDQSPFATANEIDEESGISMRLTYGSKLGENQTGFIHDAIWGSTLVDECAQRLAFAL